MREPAHATRSSHEIPACSPALTVSFLIPVDCAVLTWFTDVTDASGEITGYISNTGIPSISRLPDQELDVITPYSVFPVMLVDPAIGLVWWKNMVEGKMMQSGSSRPAQQQHNSFITFNQIRTEAQNPRA